MAIVRDVNGKLLSAEGYGSMVFNDTFEMKAIGSSGYQLNRKYMGKDGKTGEAMERIDKTYYGTVSQCLVAFLRKSIDDSNTVDELRDKVRLVDSEIRVIEAQLKEINKGQMVKR